jgi:hypothetical protein
LCNAVDGFSATNRTPSAKVSTMTLRPRAIPLRASSERSRMICSAEA